MNTKSVVLGSTLVLWLLFLIILASPSIVGANSALFALLPLVALLAFWLTIASAIILVKGLAVREEKSERSTNSPAAKILAFLIVASVVVSTATAIKSLWIEPSYAKFAFQNVATATLFGAIALTFALSTVQKNIYWLKLSKTAKLDERQMQERQQVFEASYKLAAFIILIAALEFVSHLHSITVITSQVWNNLTGHVRYPAYNLIVILFALPLIVAAWRKK